MAFLGIKVPHEIGRLLNAIEVPGEKVDSSHMHITLAYLGKNISIKQISKALEATFQVTSGTCPFLLKINSIDCFSGKYQDLKKEYPIIAPVISEPLRSLRDRIINSFIESKVKYDSTYKEYCPHITLAYDCASHKKQKINQIEWGVQEIVLWGGDSGDGRVFITFPLTIKHTVIK